MQFALCNEMFENWPLDEAFTRIVAAGYDAVEIAPFTLARTVTELSATERTRIRDLATRQGLGVSGIHWVLARTEGYHVTHPDAAVRARTSAYLEALVACCADLGGHRMIFGSPQQRSLEPGVSGEQAWEFARSAFRDAVRRAEDLGVVICFEPLAPAETNFINTAAEAIRFVDTFASPALKIILDVKAMCSESKPVPQIIRDSWPHFAYFHANDRNLKGPGFGDVDYRPIVAALREVGYDGTVSVEVFRFEEGAEAIATRSRAYLREVFGA